MSNYPVAYRRQARERGFRPPRAANDNVPRRAWQAANDNIRRGQNAAARAVPSRAAASATRFAGLRTAGLAAGRLIPWLGAALTAYELWQLWQQWSANQTYEVPELGGDWVHSHSCWAGSVVGIMAPLQNSCTFGVMTPATAEDLNNLDIGQFAHVYGTWFGTLSESRDVYEKVGTDGTAVGEQPGVVAPPDPFFPPAPQPAIDPMDLPIGQPVGIPAPMPYPAIPWRQPNPHRDPVEQPTRGPSAVPRPHPYALPRLVPGPWRLPSAPVPANAPVPSTRPLPGAVPSPEVIPIDAYPPTVIGHSPRARHRASPRPHPHVLRKPPPGTRERKVRITAAVGVLKGLGIITEGLDVVNALYDALPDAFKVKGKRSNQIERMQALYDHWDEVVLTEAVKNLLVNHIEDKVIGGLSGAAQKSFADSGTLRQIGLQSGPAL